LLIGPNNAGKTSLLLPLLLLRQTLDEADFATGLLTRGSLANVGEYADFVTNGDLTREVSLSIRLPSGTESAAADRLRLVGDETPAPSVGLINLTFGPSENSTDVVLRRYAIGDVNGTPLLTRRRTSAKGAYPISQIAKSEQILLRSGSSRPANPRIRKLRQAIASERPGNFSFSGMDVAIAALQASVGSGFKPSSDEELRRLVAASLRYSQLVNTAGTLVNNLLRQIDYIGPIRNRPERVYEISGEAPVSVGPRGEYAPEVIHRTDNKIFNAELRSWMRHFGVGSEIETRRGLGNSFSLVFPGKTGRAVNFADTGFGVSQLLPLVVQGLYADPGHLLIAEQPEIHLNPRLQTRLADLFVAFARDDRRVLVETHSEHLLLRLRRLVAEGRIPAGSVGIYFVDRHKVSPIELDQHGQIVGDWPDEFFEDALREALGLANAQSRKPN
jgi:hypothetical protein